MELCVAKFLEFLKQENLTSTFVEVQQVDTVLNIFESISPLRIRKGQKYSPLSVFLCKLSQLILIRFPSHTLWALLHKPGQHGVACDTRQDSYEFQSCRCVALLHTLLACVSDVARHVLRCCSLCNEAL